MDDTSQTGGQPTPPAPDLRAAADRMAALVATTTDADLDRATPCPAYTVRDLLAHVSGLSLAFTAAAAKDLGPMTDTPPTDQRPVLEDDWRTSIPARLDALVGAWRDPAAADGMTRAGGVDLPGFVAAVVALDELTLHGWDLARATGQDYEVDPGSVEAVLGFVTQAAAEPGDGGLFGPPVPVPDEAPVTDRIVGLAGRDPAWQPA